MSRNENRYCPHCKSTQNHLVGRAFGGRQFLKCLKCGSHKFSANQVYKVGNPVVVNRQDYESLVADLK